MTSVNNTTEDMMAVSHVLAHRLPMLALSVGYPSPERQHESIRMVAEKVQAAIEGSFEVQKYWLTAPFRAWSEPPRVDPIGDSVETFISPARRILRENVTRLANDAV